MSFNRQLLSQENINMINTRSFTSKDAQTIEYYVRQTLQKKPWRISVTHRVVLSRCVRLQLSGSLTEAQESELKKDLQCGHFEAKQEYIRRGDIRESQTQYFWIISDVERPALEPISMQLKIVGLALFAVFVAFAVALFFHNRTYVVPHADL